MYRCKLIIFPVVLILLASACNGTPASSTNPQVEPPTGGPTDYPTPYPDTPSPPKIDAPVVESPALTSIHFVNSLDGWGETDSYIVRTNDGGLAWYNVTPKDIAELGFGARLSVLDTDHAWLQKADTNNYPNAGFLYRTTDGGLTWTMFDTPFSEGELNFVDENNGWVLANLGVGVGSNAIAIYQTTDGRGTWTQKFINDPNDPNADDAIPLGGLKSGIAPLNMQTAWVYGVIYSSGTVYLYRTYDGGVNWSEVSLPLPEGAENFELGIETDQMKFVSSNDGFIVVRFTGDVYQAAIYVTHDGGNTWTLTPMPIPDGGSADFLSAEAIITYNGSQFYLTIDAAQTWSIIPPDVNFSDTFVVMDFVDVSTGWVITMDPTTGHRSLYRTVDGGATWSPVVP